MAGSYGEKTVEEHLAYIDEHNSRVEDRYLAVEKLFSALDNDLKAELQKAERCFANMAKAAGEADPQEYLKDLGTKLRQRKAKGELERWAPSVLEHLERFQLDAEPIREALTAEAIDERIKKVRSTLEKIEPATEDAKRSVSYMRQEAELIEKILSETRTRESLLYVAIYEVSRDGNAPAKHSREVAIEALKRVSEIRGFRQELEQKTTHLAKQVEIYGEDTNSSTKINWLGSKADCKAIIRFLKENGYIQAGHVNQFVAHHFLFDGRAVSAETVQGWHSDRASDHVVVDDEHGLYISRA